MCIQCNSRNDGGTTANTISAYSEYKQRYLLRRWYGNNHQLQRLKHICLHAKRSYSRNRRSDQWFDRRHELYDNRYQQQQLPIGCL